MTPHYESGGVRIYNGDCREVMRSTGQGDVVLTDPPYDKHTHASARSAARKTAGQRAGAIPIDFPPLDIAVAAPLLISWAKRWAVAFCALEMFGAYRDAAGEAYVRSGFWHRINGAPQFTGDRPGMPGDGVAIMHRPGAKRWNGGGTSAFWSTLVVHAGRVHPTQKPEALMCALVAAFSDPDELIVDPYMGSGATLVAAKRLGRRAVGIELEEKWCEAAALRLSQQTLPMFGAAEDGALLFDEG